MWRDKILEDGSFIDEPAPASSFYHIMAAYSELRQSLPASSSTPITGLDL
tara:strand:- start:266 stop:415 length:150 start_codon:yes stop_codon:yes gene_type:complete